MSTEMAAARVARFEGPGCAQTICNEMLLRHEMAEHVPKLPILRRIKPRNYFLLAAVMIVLGLEEGKECIIIGTMYKHMKLKSSILDEYSKEVLLSSNHHHCLGNV